MYVAGAALGGILAGAFYNIYAHAFPDPQEEEEHHDHRVPNRDHSKINDY